MKPFETFLTLRRGLKTSLAAFLLPTARETSLSGLQMLPGAWQGLRAPQNTLSPLVLQDLAHSRRFLVNAGPQEERLNQRALERAHPREGPGGKRL